MTSWHKTAAGLLASPPWQGRRDLPWQARGVDPDDTYSWLLEPMLERVGFEIAEREASPSRTFAACVCLRRP